jgi:hypothetical protein
LRKRFEALGHPKVTLFGEAYGGKQQGQSWRYGKNLKFVVFDVRIEDSWLSVPQAADVAAKLGLEFVHYVQVPTYLAALDASPNYATNETAKLISKAYSEFSLHSEHTGFVIMLKSDGKHVFRRLG